MRVTSKGQVTIPKHLRVRTGIRAGTEVDFAGRDGEIVMRKAELDRREDKAARTEFADYLDRVTGTVELNMSTDAFMELLRGE